MPGALARIQRQLLDWARSRAPLQQIPLRDRRELYAALTKDSRLLDVVEAPERQLAHWYTGSVLDDSDVMGNHKGLMSALRQYGLLLRAENVKNGSFDGFKHYDAVGGRQMLDAAAIRASEMQRPTNIGWRVRMNRTDALPEEGTFYDYDPFMDTDHGAWERMQRLPKKPSFYANEAEGGGGGYGLLPTRPSSYGQLRASPSERQRWNASLAVPKRHPFVDTDFLLYAQGGLV